MAQVALASGVVLDVWQEGPAGAPPVLFLHGFPESQRAWRHQIAALSAHYRCIAPDQRGYGASSRPVAVGDYALPLLAGDVLGLADALGLGRFALVGHDWGAMVAFAAAHAAPERISRLAIANGPHPAAFQERLWASPEQRAASAYITAFRRPEASALIAAKGFGALLNRHFDPRAFAGMERPEIAALFARWAEPGAGEAMLNWYRAADLVVPEPSAPPGPPPGWQPPPLAPLPMPVLAIWGEADAALPLANAAGLARWCPHLTLAPIAGAGHFTPWQAPAAVTAALAGFLGGA